MLKGTWNKNDIRRVFVAGASWWEFHSTGGTMWNSDRHLAEAEATKRYPPQQDDTPDAKRRCGLCRGTGIHPVDNTFDVEEYYKD